MDPIYRTFPTQPSVAKVAPLTPDRLDPGQRRQQETGSQRRKASDDEVEDESDEAVTEDLGGSDAAAETETPDRIRSRGDLRRDRADGGDGDDVGHIDIIV
jgi:hypothetical protein